MTTPPPPAPDHRLWAAYATILVAMATFVLSPPSLPPWRIYTTLTALALLLLLNIMLGRPLPRLQGWPYLIAAGGLTVSANWLGQVSGFLPWLIFVLTSQAIFVVPPAKALLYGATLTLSIVLFGRDPTQLREILNLTLIITAGLIFTFIFSLTTLRYEQQTQRAEALLQELQRANQELALARDREKALAVAEERVRLARDIHDGLGHHLTVLNVQLQAAAKLLTRDPSRAAAAVETCRTVAQAALTEVRHSVSALRHNPLDTQPLEQALATLVRDFDHASSMTASYQPSGAPRPLPPAIALTLYRTAQEGLTNAQKYAGGGHVVVTLSHTPTHITLQVEDDGQPQPLALPTTGGFGLAGLRERATQLGGHLTTTTRPTGGFCLEITLPLPETHPSHLSPLATQRNNP